MKKYSKEIRSIILDFDGVLTDNNVYVDENGTESVKCNRSDGLAISILQKIGYKILILSTEKNSVVKKRCNKLKVKCYSNIKNKKLKLINLQKYNILSLNNSLYIGNDINDYHAIKISKFSACPKDSHPEIKKIVTWKLKTNGGDGIMKEVAKEILDLNLLKYV